MKKNLKYIVLLLTLVIGITNVKASTTTFDRTEDDLGVNKKWVIDENNIDNVYATLRVDASEKIYDYAEILSDSEESQLYNSIKSYIETSNMDMVILTVDLPYSDQQIEDYAADFYDYNDFGIDFDLYSGIIIVRNINSFNRYFNIYTFGNAQLYYPYERCEQILDYIYNDIHAENYLAGFNSFISYSSELYNDGIPSNYNNYYVNDMGYLTKGYTTPWFLAFIISGVVTSIIMIILISKNKMVKKASIAKEYLDSSSVNYTNRSDNFISTHTTSYTVSSSSGGGGGGSHSGSSGGGHGGGGGRHG